jgi:hypothetical protein
MKNNRRNRKKVKIYFKKMNKYEASLGLSPDLLTVPKYLYTKNMKSFAVLIGDLNNPKSEIWQ